MKRTQETAPKGENGQNKKQKTDEKKPPIVIDASDEETPEAKKEAAKFREESERQNPTPIYDTDESHLAFQALHEAIVFRGPLPDMPERITPEARNVIEHALEASDDTAATQKYPNYVGYKDYHIYNPWPLKKLITHQEYVNDEGISFIGHLLQTRYPENVLFVDPTCNPPTLNARTKWPNFTPEARQKAKHLLVPLNLNRNHWILLVADLKTNEWKIYDSLRSRVNYGKLELVQTAMEKAKAKDPIRFPNLTNKVTVVTGLPQQEDLFLCGVCTLYFMQCIAEGRECNENAFDNKDATNDRLLRLHYGAMFATGAVIPLHTPLKNAVWSPDPV